MEAKPDRFGDSNPRDFGVSTREISGFQSNRFWDAGNKDKAEFSVLISVIIFVIIFVLT